MRQYIVINRVRKQSEYMQPGFGGRGGTGGLGNGSPPAGSRGRAPGGSGGRSPPPKAHNILRIFGCQTMHYFVYLAKLFESLVMQNTMYLKDYTSLENVNERIQAVCMSTRHSRQYRCGRFTDDTAAWSAGSGLGTIFQCPQSISASEPRSLNSAPASHAGQLCSRDRQQMSLSAGQYSHWIMSCHMQWSRTRPSHTNCM